MPFLPGDLTGRSIAEIESQLSCRFVPPLSPAQGKLSSRYGMRMGRTTGQPTYHAGMDFGMTPEAQEAARGGGGYPTAFAMRTGVVEVISRDEVRRGPFNGYGNCVALRHAERWEGHEPIWTFYAHLASIAVAEGEVVAAGAPVGVMGNTSNGKFRGMGVHLHVELRRAGPGGRVPYPGPYRVWNLDPEPWMRHWGLTFDRRGFFELDAARACG